MTNLILTILIPTSNRAANLKVLLESFSLRNFSSDVEILLAINASRDDSLSIAESYQKKISNLRIKYFEEFVYSAEENINRSIACCDGEYVFILGDDDELLFETFDVMVSILRSGQKTLPALIFNNITSLDKIISFRDHVKEKSCISFNGVEEEVVWTSSYSELLKNLGVITIMAFISRYVIRKDLLRDFSNHIAVSRIYSHVFAFLEFLHKERVVVVDLFLTRRGHSIVDKEFKAMSDSLSQQTFFSWHQGLLSHINAAVKNKFISPSWFFEIMEFKDDGSDFKLWTKTLEMMFFQVMEYLKNFEKNERMSRDSLDILRSFDDSPLSFPEKKAFDYILSEMEEILSEINKKDLNAREKKFFNWQIWKLYGMLDSKRSFKVNDDVMPRVRKFFYLKVLKLLKLKIFPKSWFFFIKKKVKKVEMRSLVI